MFDDIKFNVGPDKLLFSTQTNGDKITIIGLNLDAEEAAAVAYLANQQKTLEVEIKVKP